jgi:hypothetical protein
VIGRRKGEEETGRKGETSAFVSMSPPLLVSLLRQRYIENMSWKDRVANVLAHEVGPALSMDGTLLEVLDVEDGIARIRLPDQDGGIRFAIKRYSIDFCAIKNYAVVRSTDSPVLGLLAPVNVGTF